MMIEGSEVVVVGKLLLYHGTNAQHPTIAAGSWVTDDIEAAASFASSKADEDGGTACIATIQVNEEDVDWDVLAAIAGEDDMRGKLLNAIEVKSWSLPDQKEALAPG